LGEEISSCPSCGSEVREGRKYIDDYRIEEVLHEGHASILCKAVREGEEKPVMIRLFTHQSGVDEGVAARLRREIEELKELPIDGFVSHREIKRSSDGLWYRVSEWVDAENWGDLVGSGRLNDYRVAFDLFSRIAFTLEVLHQKGHSIPHLILNDIMVFEDDRGELDVKIDYKLSRFLDPKLDRPGPMLRDLLGCHPDIINQRPLDFRSDIWSLGKIFIQILTADFGICDFPARIDELPLPDEAALLFKTMLADDTDLRPSSMKEVAEALSRITDEEIEEARRRQIEQASASPKAIRRLKMSQRLLAALVVLLFAAGGLLWYQSRLRKKESAVILEEYANRYAPSVAFVLVEYWLQEGETTIYRNGTEGTAFLVDGDGFLLTARHVACPWLEDETLIMGIAQLRQNGRFPQFGYRLFLWFEGEKAFNRSAELIESTDVADRYFLGSAFRTDGTPRVNIAGVGKPPIQTRQLVQSRLRDDFAVLKIDRVPEGVQPLPIDLKLTPQKIPKLSRVIALGFPLGSQTQAASVNVSVTSGHVRRSFEDLFQIDTSLYGGNSGGPVIDMRGMVIGIASGVATEVAQGLLPVVTPRWDMAMVLPITKAATLLQDLKAGQVKWNGVLDLSVEAKLKGITGKAVQGRWSEAMALADAEVKLSLDPQLIMAAGMMHFCSGDDQGAKRFFDQSLSMDAESDVARLIVFIIDWREGRSSSSPQRQELLALDWQSPAEFIGYLVKVLDGLIDEENALESWDTESERSWLHYIVGFKYAHRGEWAEAEKLLRKAILSADVGSWEFFLARAELGRVQTQMLNLLKGKARRAEYGAEMKTFYEAVKKDQAVKESRGAKLAELGAFMAAQPMGPKERRQVLEKILEIAPGNADVLVGLAFYSAMEEAWGEALAYARTFLKRDGRENANRLSAGLLEVEILHRMGQKEKTRARLEEYLRRTKDPWYRSLGECLLGERAVDSLKKEAGESPEKLVTAFTALGFWAEGSGDEENAIEHYKVALESFMDTWIEFDFARERIRSLRQSSG
jgi:tetratricopeptide (TPR) repeat protein